MDHLHWKLNLKGCLNQMYCNKKDNILTHLLEMKFIYQQLTSQNTKISDKNYIDVIICLLLQLYSNFITSLLIIYGQMIILVTPAAIKDAIRKEHEVCQTTVISQNRKLNEIALHANTRGRG